MALARKTGTIEALEQDYEGGFQLAVVLDDDPGKDLGMPVPSERLKAAGTTRKTRKHKTKGVPSGGNK